MAIVDDVKDIAARLQELQKYKPEIKTESEAVFNINHTQDIINHIYNDISINVLSGNLTNFNIKKIVESISNNIQFLVYNLYFNLCEHLKDKQFVLDYYLHNVLEIYRGHRILYGYSIDWYTTDEVYMTIYHVRCLTKHLIKVTLKV